MASKKKRVDVLVLNPLLRINPLLPKIVLTEGNAGNGQGWLKKKYLEADRAAREAEGER